MIINEILKVHNDDWFDNFTKEISSRIDADVLEELLRIPEDNSNESN